MSHELRTPLNAIIGFSQLLRLVAKPKLNPAEIGYLGDVEGAGQHLLAVVSEILDLVRVDAGKLLLEEEEIDVGDLVSASARMLARASDEAEVKLLASAPRDEIVVRGDRTRLQQCLLNLLSNAIKFTPRGGEVEVTACIESNEDLAIWARDSGVGMTEEQIQIALQPFGQVEGAYSRTNHGVGLGLPLVKKLLEAHGGALAMHSRPKHGTWAGMLIPAERVVRFAVRPQGGAGPRLAQAHAARWRKRLTAQPLQRLSDGVRALTRRQMIQPHPKASEASSHTNHGHSTIWWPTTTLRTDSGRMPIAVVHVNAHQLTPLRPAP